MAKPKQADFKVETYALGDFALLSGKTIPDAHIAYRVYGDPKNPAVVYPTWYSGKISQGNEWLISTAEHERKSLDPARFFIICPALFGNGESSSPSNHPLGVRLPKATFYDNVKAQHRLVYDHLGVKGKVIVLGWSMGAGQTFQWATQFPDVVRAAIPFCGSARTATHNWVFLESLKYAIQTDPAWNKGEYTEQPEAGLKTFGTIYAGWGFSQAFYRDNGFEKHFGLKNLNDILSKFWHAWALSHDANNLLYMLYTWQSGDVGAQPLYAGDSKQDQTKAQGGRFGTRGSGGTITKADDDAFQRALEAVQCPVLVAPCKSDLYFPPEDSEIEVNFLGDKGTLAVFPSIWGHWAGGPGDSKEDAEWLDNQIFDFLHKHDCL